MAYVNDLHSPLDRDPGEPETDLLSPDELLDAIDDPQAHATVEALLADVRHLRGLQKRNEWAITARRDVPPSKDMPLICRSPEAVDNVLGVSGGVAWVRELIVGSWEPLEDDAPF